MIDTATFWNRAADKYEASKIGNPAAYEYTLGRTRSYLRPTDNVLEIACGTGSTAVLLAPDVASYLGTDISPEMIRIARGKLPVAGADLSFDVTGDLPETGQFDAILAHSFFHLVPDMERRMARIYDLLTPGGFFISKTATLKGRGLKWTLISAVIPLAQLVGKAPYLRKFSAAELEQAVRDAGFEIVESGDFATPARYIVARKPGVASTA
ncbi:class I SAM-dependent methyltransferase [Yoonia vestfoldensis]|jgi:SAM-dependent methyltransferase|uniref:Phthiotriol/phenolphthiotriol dimycocerosates methyltransferase n=1 Tax=Yoonia vestfoldensis TaxID=245188 RepID=A0A1Y0E7R7_9RHOB|nr:class I SAM-dependent methyltransferase [Yoonia vestfoldensis]ART99654.1 phthiotriol/phenolphthiotriol dimycocerosates methyltransferase [Yoonia vestfoldensis]